MAESTTPKTKRDFAYVIQDLAGANTYSPPIQPGNFKYQAGMYDVVQIRNVGNLYTARKGDEQPVTCSFDVYLTDVGSATYATMPDICEERGFVATDWTSTITSDVDTYDLVGTMDGSVSGEPDKDLTFEDMVFRGSADIQYPAMYSVTGTSVTKTKPTFSE
jgi:hypothetical protein